MPDGIIADSRATPPRNSQLQGRSCDSPAYSPTGPFLVGIILPPSGELSGTHPTKASTRSDE